MEVNAARNYLKKRIQEEGFFHTNDRVWLSSKGDQSTWTFDLKALLLDKNFLEATCTVFWSMYDRTKPIQICGLETASIPLITALVLTGENANGIYIRKSKKKKYDMRELEGTLRDAPIVLVDDIITSGSSMEKQISVLKKNHYDVTSLFTFVHLKEPRRYEYLKLAYGIDPKFVFSVIDFGESYVQSKPPTLRFEEEWKFTEVKGNEFNVTRRNQMFTDGTTVYLNADNGRVYALSRETGEEYWSTKIQNKVRVNSNQAGVIRVGEKVCAATEQGALWIINDRTGAVLNKFSLCDGFYGEIFRLGESQLLLTGQDGKKFIALVFDLKGEELVWKYESGSRLSLSIEPDHKNNFVIADYAGRVIAFDRYFVKRWETKVIGAVMDGATFDQTGKKMSLVTSEGMVYLVRASDGLIIKETQIDEPFLSAKPVFNNGKLYFTSLHRTVYCLEVETLNKIWEYNTKGRIFGGSTIFGSVLLFGNNEGILYAIDTKTGQWLGSYVHGDRIVSEPIGEENNRVLVQTISNQIISLRYIRNKEASHIQ